jgi:DNA polymerase-1
MKLKWGAQAVKDLYEKHGGEDDYDLLLRLLELEKSDPMKKKADDLRKDAKNVNFTAQFGGQAPKISERLIMPLEDAQLFLQARSEMFPDVEVAAKRAEQFCMNYGYATTLMGARRHLAAGIMSDSSQEQQRAARQAFNMQIQGSAAEMTKLAMSRLWKSDFLWKYDVRFIAPIHDELVTSIAVEDVVEATKIKHECMTAPYSTMKVPVWGSISIGKNFGEQVECGDWYDKGWIEKGLSDVCGRKAA